MIINIEQWNAAIEFMLTRQVEDKLYKSYAFLLAHTQLFLSLHGKELSEEQKAALKAKAEAKLQEAAALVVERIVND